MSSKLNTEWPFICHLHELGRATTEDWLADHFDDLGQRSTLDVDRHYRELQTSR